MRARIYYFASSNTKKPLFYWNFDFDGSKTYKFFKEMQISPILKSLYFVDFENEIVEKQSLKMNFDIEDENIKKEKNYDISFHEKQKYPKIYCLFRKRLFEIYSHPLIKRNDEDKSFILFTDLDDTLLGNDESLDEFYEFWIQNCLFNENQKLIYATGRSYITFNKLENYTQILYPEYLICSNGTEIYHYDKDIQDYMLDLNWEKTIMINWNSEIVLEKFRKIYWLLPNLNSPHDNKALRFFATLEDLQLNFKEIENIIEDLKSQKIFISIVYSGHEIKKMVDINPLAASKGNAALYLIKKLNFEKKCTFGFGDSNNDLDLLKKCKKGIFVANAQKEVCEMYKEFSSKESDIIVSKFCYARALFEEMKNFLKNS